MFKAFRIPIALSAVGIGVAFLFGGLTAGITVAILGLLEITFSFDNAIVNAKVLKRMSPYWQKIFLTVGILIAVFGMRLLFPLLIVCISAGINPLDALNLALTDPKAYGDHIQDAHTAIAAFGGTFLLMLFLDWILDQEKDVHWLAPVERIATRIGALDGVAVVLACSALLIASSTLGHASTVLTAGLFGLVTYLLVSSIDTFFNEDSVMDVAKAGLATFLYLEVLDASFSFDGVVGAFAVTSNIFYIALGLGIGAVFIRSLTVHLTRQGTLNDYRYLDHGAHWAIGSLAILLLATIRFDISDIITGLIGITFISASFGWSILANRREVA